MSALIWLTMGQVLDRVPLSRNTVYAELLAGNLAGKKIGRKWLISEAALEEWLAPTESPTELGLGGAVESFDTSMLVEVSCEG